MLSQSLQKWAPRLIAATVFGYYGLGYAYEFGLMHRIDLIAMAVLKHFSGRAGMGTFMPIFQPYAAYGVRITSGFCGACMIDLFEKLVVSVYQKMENRWYNQSHVEIATA